MSNSATGIIDLNCKWAISSLYADYETYYTPLISVAVLNSLLSLLAVSLDILTIVIFYKEKRFKSFSDILLSALAGTDLLAGSLSMLLLAATNILLAYNKTSCTVFFASTAIRMTGFTLTFSVTVLISIDRLIAVFYPYHYHLLQHNGRLTAKILITVWSLCLAISIFSIFTPKLILLRTTAIFSIAVGVPFSWWVHLRALFLAKRMRAQIQDLQVGEENREQRDRTRREVKATRSTTVILGCIFICYLPHPVISIFKMFRLANPLALQFISAWTIICVMLSSVLNPLVYVWQLQWFRNAFLKLAKNRKPSARPELMNSTGAHSTSVGQFSVGANQEIREYVVHE